MRTDHVLDVYPRRRGEALRFGLQETIGLAHIAKMSGKAYAAVDGDLVIAVGGISLSHPGVGNAWLLGTDDIQKYAGHLTMTIKKKISSIMEELNVDRIQCDVLVEKENWVRWAEYLGFEREGILRKFRGGKDAYVLSIVRK